MSSYKYESAQAWLQQKILETPAAELVSLASELAQHLDADEIQDVFESEMDQDGFFIDLDAKHSHLCPDCGCIIGEGGIDCADGAEDHDVGQCVGCAAAYPNPDAV